jgi:protein-S-isoprenylcysteine O-methyltransferase Ste14
VAERGEAKLGRAVEVAGEPFEGDRAGERECFGTSSTEYPCDEGVKPKPPVVELGANGPHPQIPPGESMDLAAGMNSDTSTEAPTVKSETSRAVRRRVLQVVITYLALAAILFISSGTLNWIWAWAYLGLGLGIIVINSIVLPAELIGERGQPKGNVKRWDRVLTAIAGLPALGVPIVVGLDQRLGWSSPVAPLIHLTGLALFAMGQALFSWAMASNKYFSTLVRIQVERGHSVATGGPYHYIRHPGYMGYAVSSFGMALALGSLWAMIPAGFVACLLVVRTALEDRMLQEELSGYKDYSLRVRYRLLPGIW